MKKALMATTLMATTFASAAFAQTPPEQMPAGDYKLDLSHASIVWKVSHLGLSDYVARFTDFDATLTYDPETPTNSKLVATIDPTSVATAYPHPEKKDFDKKLVEGEGWFNALQFPEITYISERIEMTGDTTARVYGTMNMLGVEKPLALDVEFNAAMEAQPFSGKPTMGFSATTVVERSGWGMDTYVPNIGNDVAVMIEAEMFKAN